MAECAAMSAAQRLVAISVGVIVLVAIAILVGLNVSDGGIGDNLSAAPSISDIPSPSQSEALSDAPSPTDEGDVRAALAEIEEQVIAIRGLPAADIGAPELLTRDAFRKELLASFEEDYPPDEQAEDNASLKALGLLEPDQDIAELQLQLLGDQVLGFYDDDEQRMVVVTDEGLDALAKFTYAHEYTHALQDAAFDLETLGIEEEGEDDRALARVAMVEGDATATMFAWAFAHMTPAELAEITSAPQPDTSGIPSWLVEQTAVFPYVDGLAWASALAGDPLSPSFGELDTAYADAPTSTEQIVHLEKWDPREEPIPVNAPDLAAELGDGWTEVDDTPIGEAFLRMMLEYHGIPRDEALAASDGWGGDRVVIATGPDDAFAVAWRLAWDTPADAAEFVDTYTTAMAGFDFRASVSDLGDAEVLVAHASDDTILRRAIDIAGD
jgi:hypothetical protein